jgi:hypothetical protein
MAVISNISVGDIMYYQVDDIPTHTAPKGSVAIMADSSIYSNGFTYINNDGGTTWLKCISPKYGGMELTDQTGGVDFATQTPGSWYAFSASPAGASWTLVSDSSPDWIIATEDTTTDDLEYTGSTTMRVSIENSSTIRGGALKYMDHRHGTAFNFTVPDTWNECFTYDNGATTNCGAIRLLEMTTNDYILGGISAISRESGGGAAARTYIPKHFSVDVIKLDEPLIQTPDTVTLISENWESNSFSAWTVSNDATNQWEIGTAQVDTGTYGAYGSNDGGTTANYSDAGDVSHFYQDITIPSDATNVSLVFVWRSWMENAGSATQYDYGTVNIIDTSTTPIIGTEVATALATGGGNGRINQTGANDGKFNEAYRYGGGTYDGTWFTETIDLVDYIGTTKRLVFSFADDGVAPADAPAMSIDNITLTYDTGATNVY